MKTEFAPKINMNFKIKEKINKVDKKVKINLIQRSHSEKKHLSLFQTRIQY